MFIDIDDPKLMFCLDVRGWLFGTGEPVASLDKARADGAVAAVAPIQAGPVTTSWLDRNGAEVYRGRQLRIVRFGAQLDQRR